MSCIEGQEIFIAMLNDKTHKSDLEQNELLIKAKYPFKKWDIFNEYSICDEFKA